MRVVPHVVPHGWQCTTLREIAEIIGGVTKDTKKSLGQGFREVPYLRVANVQRGRLDLTEMKLISASEADIQKLKLLPGDILLNEGGDRDKLGRGWIWQGQLPLCIHQNHVFRARLSSRDIDPLYVAHFTNSMAQAYFAEQGSQTTNLASISLTKLGSLPIWLPPSKEQTRIVAKLEELLSDLDAGVAELKAAQKKLAQYRQSLLKAAVEGALTAEWRKQNTPAETGAQLLQRVLTARRARWEAKQLNKFMEQGKSPPKDWQKKYPEPVQPDTTGLPELPKGWVWASMDQLAEFITSGSRGWADYYSNSGATFIRSQNINKDWLDMTDIAFVNPPRSAEGARTRVRKNDLLLTITGANVGKAALVDIDIDDAYVSQHVSLIRMIEAEISVYLHTFLTSSAGGRGQLDKEAYGAGKPGLNLQQVAAVVVPLPGMPEIRALMEAVAMHIKSADDQRAAITASLKQSTAQRQNILRAAFSGQLVPQDPNDEPASVLLERIRAERAERAGVKKPRGRKLKESA